MSQHKKNGLGDCVRDCRYRCIDLYTNNFLVGHDDNELLLWLLSWQFLNNDKGGTNNIFFYQTLVIDNSSGTATTGDVAHSKPKPETVPLEISRSGLSAGFTKFRTSIGQPLIS